MSRYNIVLIPQFILLLFVQAFLLSNINFFGFINPNLYLLLFLMYRFDGDRTALIILGFLMGLLLDLLTQGSGGHTIASLTITYLRPYIIRFSFGVNYDVPMGMIRGSLVNQRVAYFLQMILIHHLLLFVVIYFSFDNILTIMKNTFLSAFFTFILVYISLGLFKERK
ncbi:MAG: rod shape-determining protein MreD [Flavobacteriaceae bacterium]|tara:strand:- start:8895 stop:9398 length:504 start_codon:yes stop_codon:yes gene_type:complete